ncbi:4Fe-4S dicluster domain-containing protein, partial [Cyclobacteriaceae bacterium]|nr:4Fe-4S dicluster domain-containing protein [Cyclobacteriaceae bacterium]
IFIGYDICSLYLENVYDLMKGANNTYWGNFSEAVKTLNAGLWITFRHFIAAFKKNRKPISVADKDYLSQQDVGVFTLQYPNESFPVPDNGRYRLHNEIDDCIVCDKCVKICPVNCIDIESIRSGTEIKKASDGSSIRLHASKFDIDMAKCMYCGLCTTVCPTECLTMTKTYDFSEYNVDKLNYKYSEMTPQDIEEKQNEWDIFQAAKKAKANTTDKKPTAGIKPKVGMPKIKPNIKPKQS